jgi:hypothetical protein
MNINKDYLIGGAAVAAIALVGYFSFSMNVTDSNTSDLATTNVDILEVVVTSDTPENDNADDGEKHETLNAVETNTADNVVE